jgi:hypothetical protein
MKLSLSPFYEVRVIIIMITVFRDVTPCSLTDIYKFGETSNAGVAAVPAHEEPRSDTPMGSMLLSDIFIRPSPGTGLLSCQFENRSSDFKKE